MKARFVLTMFLFGALAVSDTQAQLVKSVNLNGPGARAEGFGGAFTGVADDATAIMWNPAGLAQLERPEGSVVGRWLMDGYKDPDYNYDKTKSRFAFNFLSLAYPVNLGDHKLVLALAYQQQIDLFLSDLTAAGIYEKQTGGIYTITPGVAYKITPIFLVGGSANIWTGTSDYKNGDGVEYSDDWSGLNFQIGAMADFSGMGHSLPLKIGVSYRTPFTMKDKYKFPGDPTKYSYEWDFPTIIGIGASYRIGENLTVAADYEIQKFAKAEIKDVDNVATYDFSESQKDVSPIRVGAEYLWVGDFGAIPIRAGFKTVPTLLADVDGAGFLTNKQVAGTAISFGSGFVTRRFAIDVAYTMSSYKKKYVGFSPITFSKSRVSTSLIVYL